jgi:hypothetical protein
VRVNVQWAQGAVAAAVAITQPDHERRYERRAVSGAVALALPAHGLAQQPIAKTAEGTEPYTILLPARCSSFPALPLSTRLIEITADLRRTTD